MRQLKLYKEIPKPGVEEEPPLEINKDCERCGLCKTTSEGKRCLPASGTAKECVLVVTDSPSKYEAQAGSGHQTTASLKSLVEKYADGAPVVYTYAVKCFAGGSGKVAEEAVDQCRGYLRKEIEDLKPTRVICIGFRSAKAVLGRSVDVDYSSKFYSFLPSLPYYNYVIPSPTPVFMLPYDRNKNTDKFRQLSFEKLLEWALTTADISLPPWWSGYKKVETEADAVAACEALRVDGTVHFDCEWIGTPLTDKFRLLCLSATSTSDMVPYVWGKDVVENKEVLQPLLDLLVDKETPKGGQNVKADIRAIWAAYGVKVNNVVSDTRYKRKTLDATCSSAALGTLAEMVGMGGHKKDMDEEQKYAKKAIQASRRLASGAVKKPTKTTKQLLEKFETDDFKRVIEASCEDLNAEVAKYSYGLVDSEVLERYNAMDTYTTAAVDKQLDEELSSEDNTGVKRVWGEFLAPALEAFAQVELWGVKPDVSHCRSFHDKLTMDVKGWESDLQEIKDINWNSVDQKRKFFYDELQLHKKRPLPRSFTKRTETPTDKAALAYWEDLHPCIPILQKKSQAATMLRYASQPLDFLGADGRIHPDYKLDGAETGRISCADPPLQQIPRPDSVNGKLARDCYVCESDDFQLLQVDYSQLELRVAAMLSGDDAMAALFTGGEDFHLGTAKLVAKDMWGIDPSEVEKIHRSAAKAFNFGLLYGKTDASIAETIGVDIEKAVALRQSVLGKFDRLHKWLDTALRETQQTGYCHTAWDGARLRRRALFDICNDFNRKAQSNARNASVNTPIQGTASDFCIKSIVEIVSNYLPNCGLDAKLVLTVHDSIIFEVRKEHTHKLALDVREIMEGWPSGNVNLSVDGDIGPRWGSLTPYNIDKGE